MERKGVAQPVTLRTETRRRHTDKDVATKVNDVATKKGGRAANKDTNDVPANTRLSLEPKGTDRHKRVNAGRCQRATLPRGS